jgi:DNA-binding NtrC family response regulator
MAVGDRIMAKNRLEGKKVLIVDDETDVLESLQELLPMCRLETAASFEEARAKLENQEFDLAILDIMGVNGYELLELAGKKKVISVMLTAHALSPEHTVISYEKGAASFVPKEKMAKIETYLNDILEAQTKGKNFWWRWLERFNPYYEKRFGSDWSDHDRKFWDNFKYWIQ